jgi:uncharacterized protein
MRASRVGPQRGRDSKGGILLERSVELSIDAVRQGHDTIFQGALLRGAWGGYPDFLERVDRPFTLGACSYEVIDTKLKRKPDPKHVLQLEPYFDLLSEVQVRALRPPMSRLDDDLERRGAAA